MKTLKITTIAIILTMCLVFAIGCAPSNNEDAAGADKSALTAVEGMSAYDLFKEVETRWYNDTACHRQDYFSFKANNGSVATQQSLFESFRDGEKYFSRNIVLGTGFGSRHDMESIYYDGTSAKVGKIDSRSAISKNKDSKDPFTREYYTIKDNNFGIFEDRYNFASEEERLESFKHNYQHVTTYDTSKREYLAADHDDTVYKYTDGTLVFTITIDCSVDKMNTIHTAARDEFLKNTGAKNEGFEILKDTTIEFTAKKFGDVYKMTSWLRTEQYAGNHAQVGIKVSCFQQSKCIITYDDYQITQDVIKTKVA